MIGRTVLAATLLLAFTDLVVSGERIAPATNRVKPGEQSFYDSGKYVPFLSKYCDPSLKLGRHNQTQFCTSFTRSVKLLNNLESTILCRDETCRAKYDPLSGLCQCSWGSAEQMNEEHTWPGKNCELNTTCHGPFEAHWNPSAESCTCAIDTFPQHGSIHRFEPSAVKEKLLAMQIRRRNGKSIKLGDDYRVHLLDRAHQTLEKLQRLETQVAAYRINVDKHLALQFYHSTKAVLQKLRKQRETLDKLFLVIAGLKNEHQSLKKRLAQLVQSTAPATSTSVSFSPLPTYIPPPNTQVTQDLLQASLSLQPQQLAIIGSAIPHFADGIISFHVQLDGPISQTLVLNATDVLPCENIGADPQPSLIVVPKTVRNGAQETVLPTCLVIAVNIYDPKYITYWVQKEDGSVFSLLSDNKIHAIDQLDTSQPANVEIRVATSIKNAKRGVSRAASPAQIRRRQIFSVACDRLCPFYHMQRVQGSDGYCGCMFESANNNLILSARGVEAPTQYTATMSAEACAAMTCINNGGKPALFNPFTATCWCTSPKFVEVNDDAYSGGL